MKIVKFTKMQGSGNDFAVVDRPAGWNVSRLKKIVPKMCDRKYGVGCDGLLLLERSERADVRMRIFNADGTEAEMCGNGARCAAFYISWQTAGRSQKDKTMIQIETKAGIIKAQVKGECVRVGLTDPLDLKFGMEIVAEGKKYEVNYLNTGVPHAVIEVDDLDGLPVKQFGRAIRHHEVFRPCGTNVDFFKAIDDDHILVRTYERGVEDETLACGTGSVASAIISALNSCGPSPEHLGRARKVYVKTRSGETLVVYFKASKNKITDVWLEGRVKIVYKGDYYV